MTRGFCLPLCLSVQTQQLQNHRCHTLDSSEPVMCSRAANRTTFVCAGRQNLRRKNILKRVNESVTLDVRHGHPEATKYTPA